MHESIPKYNRVLTSSKHGSYVLVERFLRSRDAGSYNFDHMMLILVQ